MYDDNLKNILHIVQFALNPYLGVAYFFILDSFQEFGTPIIAYGMP